MGGGWIGSIANQDDLAAGGRNAKMALELFDGT